MKGKFGIMVNIVPFENIETNLVFLGAEYHILIEYYHINIKLETCCDGRKLNEYTWHVAVLD